MRRRACETVVYGQLKAALNAPRLVYWLECKITGIHICDATDPARPARRMEFACFEAAEAYADSNLDSKGQRTMRVRSAKA